MKKKPTQKNGNREWEKKKCCNIQRDRFVCIVIMYMKCVDGNDHAMNKKKLFFLFPLFLSLSPSLANENVCLCRSAFRISDCCKTSGEKHQNFSLYLFFSCKISQPHAAVDSIYIWRRNCVDWAGIRLPSTSKNDDDGENIKKRPQQLNTCIEKFRKSSSYSSNQNEKKSILQLG